MVHSPNKHVSQCGQTAPRIVFLDFDGVILESVEAKEDAYRELFKDYPNRVGEIVTHYRTHAGLPRTERLRQVVGEILGEVGPLPMENFPPQYKLNYCSQLMFERMAS